MLAMLHRDTRRPWRMGRRKLWGGDISPPSVPQPWMLELLSMGYEPACLVGPAGTLIHLCVTGLDPSISGLHRLASLPMPLANAEVAGLAPPQ